MSPDHYAHSGALQHHRTVIRTAQVTLRCRGVNVGICNWRRGPVSDLTACTQK